MNLPSQNTPTFTLKDLIDVSAFQVLLDSFSCLTGIAAAILDMQGEILAASGWQDICTEFHRKNPAATLRCLESDTVLASKLAQGEQYNIYKCKNGLVDIAAPIVIDKVHVGNLFVGQFLFEQPDVEFFARQAEEFGFDKELYLQALAKVPIFSHEKIQHTIKFLTNLTAIIGNEGLHKKKLFELNWSLERRIQDRTQELRDSHERLRVLSESTFEGIIISEKGIIVEANDNAASMFGYGRPLAMVGIKMTNFVAPEQREMVENKIASGDEVPYETFGLKKDGTLFPVQIHGKMFSCRGQWVRGTAIRDMTEQKKAEQEIQTLQEILPLCSYCKKIRNDAGDWERVDVYIHERTKADISHSICPECMKEHFPEDYKELRDVIH